MLAGGYGRVKKRRVADESSRRPPVAERVAGLPRDVIVRGDLKTDPELILQERYGIFIPGFFQWSIENLFRRSAPVAGSAPDESDRAS